MGSVEGFAKGQQPMLNRIKEHMLAWNDRIEGWRGPGSNEAAKFLKPIIWEFYGDGVAMCPDGRLCIFDETGCLIFPSPARAIYTDMQARKLARAGGR